MMAGGRLRLSCLQALKPERLTAWKQGQRLDTLTGKGGWEQQEQARLWKQYIAWEKSNVQMLPGPTVAQRVNLAYEQATMPLQQYPEVQAYHLKSMICSFWLYMTAAADLSGNTCWLWCLSLTLQPSEVLLRTVKSWKICSPSMQVTCCVLSFRKSGINLRPLWWHCICHFHCRCRWWSRLATAQSCELFDNVCTSHFLKLRF